MAANWSKLWADYNEDKFYGRHPPQYPPAHAGVALNLKWSHFRGASITHHTHTITILSTTTRSTNTELRRDSFKDFQIGPVKGIRNKDNLLSNKNEQTIDMVDVESGKLTIIANVHVQGLVWKSHHYPRYSTVRIS